MNEKPDNWVRLMTGIKQNWQFMEISSIHFLTNSVKFSRWKKWVSNEILRNKRRNYWFGHWIQYCIKHRHCHLRNNKRPENLTVCLNLVQRKIGVDGVLKRRGIFIVVYMYMYNSYGLNLSHLKFTFISNKIIFITYKKYLDSCE